jgi:IS30 family transposase
VPAWTWPLRYRQHQQHRLPGRRYSPEQVSGRLKVEHPDDPSMRVSHESICQSIYVYPAAS